VRDRPEGFAVLSGDDSWTLPIMGVGGDGVISVASNEVPAVMVELCAAAARGDMEAAWRVHYRYLELMRVNFITTSPAPVKAAMAEMGLITDALRMPMLPLDDANRTRVRAVLADLDLLPSSSEVAA
jgi:4-hydroxy-tetrahydrodipicolinate synthase